MGILEELRSAARALLREPVFTLVCVLMLALGIGANTAIFSIVNGALLRTLPYKDPDRLVALREIVPAVAESYPELPVTARHFHEFRNRSSSFESLSALSTGTQNLTGAGEPERLQTARVSANFLDTLGVQPALGRGFLSGEDREGQDQVVIVSDAFWKRRLQADPEILGSRIVLDGVACTVVGILPPGFRFPSAPLFDSGPMPAEKPEVLRPILFSKQELQDLMGMFNYPAIGRLKRGVTREAAQAELDVIAAQLEKMSGEKVNLREQVTPLQENLVGRSRRSLILLLGAVGAVLLIACVNLANIMLARAERRGREWAVRAALGAGRARLVRQVFAETFVIALAGGTIGLALAAASLGELIRHAPPSIPRLDETALDLRVLFFTCAVTLATGLLFGLAPAWRCTLSEPQTALKAGGRTSTSERRGARFRNALVSAEVGLCAVLLILAALLGSSFLRVMNADKGFRAPSVLAADLAIPRAKYQEDAQRNRFHEEVLARLQSQPGVASAAISTALPLTGETWIDSVWVPGDQRPGFERPKANVRFVSEDYLRTMGIPLIAGRVFNRSDRQRKVVVVSEQLAGTLWPGRNALGRQFTRADEQLYEVIGIAGDVKTDPDKPPVAMIYWPYWDEAPRQVMLVARAEGDPRSIAAAMRDAIRSVDPDVPVPEMRTMREILEESVEQRRFQMLLTASFAATALLLAALGIYGVVSYTVARRTGEMGIRTALGATPRRLQCKVLGEAMIPVAAGLAAGVTAALAAGRLTETLLYGVGTRDPAVICGAAGMIAAVALAASWAPTRRATRVDPVEVLRYE